MPPAAGPVDSRMSDEKPAGLLPTIETPADLRALSAHRSPRPVGRTPPVPDPDRRPDGRPPRRRPRHGRARRRAALRFRHALRPADLGRRAPGLSAQGADRPPAPARQHQAARRARALPGARRERLRQLRRRPFEHVDQRRARHGDREPHHRQRPARGRRHRRRRDERRARLGGAESCRAASTSICSSC